MDRLILTLFLIGSTAGGSSLATDQNAVFGNDNFASTLTGMLGALQEMQQKGDQMMEKVAKQEKVLISLNIKVNKTQDELSSLEDIAGQKKKEVTILEGNIRRLKQERNMEVSRKMKAEQEKKSVEGISSKLIKDLNSLKEEKLNMTKIIKAFHTQKNQLEKEIELTKEERQAVETELDISKKEMTKHKLLLKASKNDSLKLKEMRTKLEEIESVVEERQVELTNISVQIEQSSLILENIQQSINNSRSGVEHENELSPSPSPTPVPRQEPAALLPPLLVSILINVITGGHILINKISSEKTSDSFLPNILGGLLPSLMDNFHKKTPDHLVDKKDIKYKHHVSGPHYLQDHLAPPSLNAHQLPQSKPSIRPNFDSVNRQGDVIAQTKESGFKSSDSLIYPSDLDSSNIDLDPSTIDMDQLYNMMSDFTSSGDNLGQLELTPALMQAINYIGNVEDEENIDTAEERQGWSQNMNEDRIFMKSQAPESFIDLPRSF